MFSERLKELRKEAHLTLDQLSDLYNKRYKDEGRGLNKGTLSKYEHGNQKPLGDTVSKLASIFNVTTDYLYGNSKYKTEQEYELYCSSLQNQSSKEEMVCKQIQDVFGKQTYDLFDSYSRLNEKGKSEAVKRLAEMVEIDRYSVQDE
jgi:transcriptional regulator with XRE-family HTH domain